MLEGTASIAGVAGGTVELHPGDIVMVLSGDAHAVRNQKSSTTASLDFLSSGEYADTPPTLTVGEGRPTTRMLGGRLKVRWPGGRQPRAIPPMLRVRSTDDVVNFDRLIEKATGAGAMAILTRAATLLFVSALRDHPQCQMAFQEYNLQDPVSRARQYMETHPFDKWTVDIIARKVGMGRSSFATRFMKEVGRTPMEFLSEERMKHAAQFLEKTDMKVAEVAERVGYRSEAAFIRRFTASFGLTPCQWRKESRRAAQAQVRQSRRPMVFQTLQA